MKGFDGKMAIENKYSVKSFTLKYFANSPPPSTWVGDSSAVADLARGLIRELDGGTSVEHLGVLFLNTQNKLIGIKIMGTGTVDQVAVYPRMIMTMALVSGATGIIIFHNHPSGEVEPSENDRAMTRAVKAAGQALEVRVLDHVIVSDENKYSFVDHGII